MLRQRVITALIIIGVFVAVLVLAPFPVQALLFALVAFAGAWEWSALVGCQSVLARAAYETCCSLSEDVRASWPSVTTSMHHLWARGPNIGPCQWLRNRQQGFPTHNHFDCD